MLSINDAESIGYPYGKCGTCPFLYITNTKIVFQEDYSHKCATFLEINEFEVGNNFLNKGVG